MIAHAVDWLRAGNPAHWVYMLSVGLILAEDTIARSPLRANSTVQLVFDLLGHLPGVGPVLAKLGSPKPVDLAGAIVQPEAKK